MVSGCLYWMRRLTGALKCRNLLAWTCVPSRALRSNSLETVYVNLLLQWRKGNCGAQTVLFKSPNGYSDPSVPISHMAWRHRGWLQTGTSMWRNRQMWRTGARLGTGPFGWGDTGEHMVFQLRCPDEPVRQGLCTITSGTTGNRYNHGSFQILQPVKTSFTFTDIDLA